MNDNSTGTGTNGLTPYEKLDIEVVRSEISTIITRIGQMKRHRSYSLAITNLDQARHWMRDRLERGPD